MPRARELSDGVPSHRVVTRRLPLAVAVAAGIAATGCGTASNDQAGVAQVKRTVQTALRDLADGDGRAFCALATSGERRRLAAAFATRSCARAMHGVGVSLTREHRAALRAAAVRRVTMSGATATVAAADIVLAGGAAKGFLSDDGRPTTLVRQAGDRWLIDG